MGESTFLTKWPDFECAHSYPLLLCSHFHFIVTIAFLVLCCDAFAEIEEEMTQECYDNMSWSVSIQYLIHFQVVLFSFRMAGEKAMLQLIIFQNLQFSQHSFFLKLWQYQEKL